MANQALVSDWVNADAVESLLGFAQIGDLLEFDRRVYHHWGVFAGLKEIEDGQPCPVVIHFAGPDHVSPVKAMSRHGWGKVGILMEELADVVADHRVRINNGLDKTISPCDVDCIMQRAEELIGNGDWVYQVTTNNCEHFVTHCRYGKKMSLQIQAAALGAGVGLGTLAAVSAVSLAYRALSSSKSGDLGKGKEDHSPQAVTLKAPKESNSGEGSSSPKM